MKKWTGIIVLLAILIAGCKKDAKESPAILTTVDATSVTSDGAVTGGNITSDGGSGISKRGVCYATHPTPTIADSVTSDGGGTGNFTSTLTILYGYTKYYVRAYAINGAGTAYGDEITFTTATGLASVTTAAVTNIVSLSALGNGTVLGDGGSPITSRGICWSITHNPTITNFKSVNGGTAVGSFSDSLKPLGSQITYYVRAYVTNDFGTAYGNEVSFTSSSSETVTDIDGNTYGTVTIGTQTWMTSNLKVAHYQNGDPMTDGSANDGEFYLDHYWDTTTTAGAYSYPAGDPANNDLYGKYYDIIDLQDSRGICPSGWHVPSDDEWKTLEMFEGMSQEDADNFGLVNRGTIGKKFLPGGSTGLNIQLAGLMIVNISYGKVISVIYTPTGIFGSYWSGDKVTLTDGFGTILNPQPTSKIVQQFYYRAFNYPSVSPDAIVRSSMDFERCLSVRCVKG